MRKFYIILTGILFTLLFATCKQFTTDIDDYLGYWSSEAFIRSSTIDKKTYNDANGMASVASADEVTVTLKIQNPKSFWFVMPPASKPKKIVEFAHFAGPKPEAGTDYKLTQPSADTLQLVYNKSFLEKAEWGEKDISSTITLYADDGREFKQTFTIPLKANTPPPKPGYAVAKTTGTPAYYVLCITVPDMDKTAGGGLLHKDLDRIEINRTPYTFSVDEGQHKFTKPESPVFITHSDVEKLSNQPNDAIPADSSWVLYYKTDVEVKDGAAKKDYTIKLIDKKGLASDIVNASTKPNKPEAEEITITEGTKFSGNGGSATDPIIIGTNGDKAEIRIASATANTTVHCTRTDTGSSASIPYDGNPVTVPLPLNGGREKQYKLEYYTDGEGFAATPVKTIYYKVVKAYTVTYRVEIVDEVAGGKIKADSGSFVESGSTSVEYGGSVGFTADPTNIDWKVAEWKKDDVVVNGTSTTYSLSNVTADTTVTVKFYQSTLKNPTAKWRDLARAVKSAPDNATLTIDGEIKATNAEGDNGVINTYKRLTIKGNNSSAALNADSKSGILDAHNTLTLQNITLKNGKWLSNHSGGAGVYVNSGGTLIMKGSSIIENCSADNSGGGVYVSGGTFEMHDTSKITGCSANKEGGGVYVQQGGTFKMHNSSAIISCSANKGGAIFVNGATVNITNCTLKGNEAVSDGGAIYAQKEGSTASTVTISGGTIGGTGTDEKNKVTGKWHFGGGIFVDDGCTLTLYSVRIIGTEAWRAGGVRANRSTVNMTNCTIKNNKTTGNDDSGGGGVYTFMGKLTMTGCTITGNEAATNGGGLNVEGTTTNITNCTFTGNTAKNGGGIYTKKEEGTPASVTISGGTIGGTGSTDANKATGTDSDEGGGGIYVGKDCKVTLQNNGSTGCTITGNTAQRGSGVYVNGEIFTMSGNTKIAVDNDVYLKTGKTITVDGTLSNNPAARITPESYRATTVLKGAITTGSPQNYTKFTVTPDGSPMTWNIDSSGTLTVTAANATQLHNAIQSAQAGIPLVITITQGFTITESTESLKIQNGRDITVQDDGTSRTLDCPNRDQHKYFCVENGGKLTLQGKITLKGRGLSNNERYALYVEAGGTAEIKGEVTITDFKGNTWGCVNTEGTVIMFGGKIAGNHAGYGGGVCISSSGIFTMKGGSIEGNEGRHHGKAMYISGTFNWKGGTIKGHWGSAPEVLYKRSGGKINNTSGNTES